MDEKRLAREEIADMGAKVSLPRKSGELVFHDDWEKRAFAIAVVLCERGHYPWKDFQARLIAEISAVGESAENPNPSNPGYYELWLRSLEKVLSDCGLDK
jgi:nitrile hydratase accessory protein|tara:strand:+ start:324 stop:623 length:300 start_codon:yes stop_codon:yes gene_type:complete